MRHLPSLLMLLSATNLAQSSCFIDEVVDLSLSGYTQSEVRRECGNRVDESNCNVDKIIRYVNRGKSVSYILRRCENQDIYSNESRIRNEYQTPTPTIASFCSTPYGSCPMAVPIPQGSACYCPSVSGPVWGIGR